MKVVIVDYGQGNISSVANKLKHQRIQTIIAKDAATILQADKIILPGVGHFTTAMAKMKSLGVLPTLDEMVIGQKKPILGICLGMQLMANFSEEGNEKGLGWISADVRKLQFKNPYQVKVPHTGWNSITLCKPGHPLLEGIAQGTEFYFTHTYHVVLNNKEEELCSAQYDEQVFTAALSYENIFGVQFHPEKSHKDGQLLIDNFIKM